VSHDGTFNAESAYGTTEEIWFMNWEFGGPPWKNGTFTGNGRRTSMRRISKRRRWLCMAKMITGSMCRKDSIVHDAANPKVPSKMLYFPTKVIEA
jgi:hypothetical protein